MSTVVPLLERLARTPYRDDAYAEAVAGLEPEEFVILVDSVDFQDFFHVFFFTFCKDSVFADSAHMPGRRNSNWGNIIRNRGILLYISIFHRQPNQ